MVLCMDALLNHRPETLPTLSKVRKPFSYCGRPFHRQQQISLRGEKSTWAATEPENVQNVRQSEKGKMS